MTDILQTEAEKLGLHRCPKCEMRRLKETKYSDGSKRHECVSCGYLQYWRPSASSVQTR